MVAGTPHWSHRVDIAAADPLALPNVAYTLHFYAGSNAQSLRTLAAAALRRGIALMVTEWGTCRADATGPVHEEECARWFDFLEHEKLGYVNWSIADKAETAAALLPGAQARWRMERNGTVGIRPLRARPAAPHERPRSLKRSRALALKRSRALRQPYLRADRLDAAVLHLQHP